MRQFVISPSITNRDSISLLKYLQEINKVPMVTSDEEVQLARCIRKGDAKALHTLTVANLRFVVSVAKQYQAQGLALGDLINEGNMGLIKAAKQFDETKGFKFISYAVWWIRQSIVQAIAEKTGIVHVPFNKKSLFKKIKRAQVILEQQLERNASAEELSAMMEVSVAEIQATIVSNMYHQSLDAPIGENDEATLIDTLSSGAPGSDYQVHHHQSLHKDLEQALKRLSDMEIKILCLTYGIGMPQQSLEEIGHQFDLSGERIRQLRKRALTKMRNSSRADVLRTYLNQ
jgi:RNA polymerase primary sigma factor